MNMWNTLAEYIQRLLGITLRLEDFNDQSLPFYLNSIFSFRTGILEGHSFLFCALKAEYLPTPSQLANYQVEIHKKSSLEPVFVFPSLSSWNRQRLIESKIPFIVPGKQLYMPMILIDLREHFQRPHTTQDRLSMPAQYSIICQLLNASVEGGTVRQLARTGFYSAISMSRAFEELTALGLADTIPGKTRPLHFLFQRQKLWETALPYLQSPVKKRFYISADYANPEWPLAGLSALSSCTMLDSGALPCFAMGKKDIEILRNQGIIEESPRTDTDIELESWAYNPRILCGPDSPMVDPFSLFLSLQDENDERVRYALNNLLKEYF